MLKTVWRSIIKTKSLSIIHITGLAIAIAASTVLFLTAMFELSFDNFHENGERIGLIYSQSEPETGLKNNSSMPAPLTPQLKATIPSIESATRVLHGNVILKNGEKEFVSTNRFVDPDFLSIFSFPMLSGNKTSLDQLNDIVLTDAMAKKPFWNK
jgi:hypothetical protein